MRTDLADCKRRLSKLEKIVEEKDDEIITRWVAQMRANGATLKTFRKKLGISQTDLSILLDTNPATVNRWESGRVRLSRKSCEKIAKIHALNASEAHHILQEKYVLQKKT
jgi:DNA-binding transcriptional regulator YiaG